MSHKKELISLEEYNKTWFEYYLKEYEEQCATGIECPECKEELYDIQDGFITTIPSQYKVKCLNCTYTGQRY